MNNVAKIFNILAISLSILLVIVQQNYFQICI